MKTLLTSITMSLALLAAAPAVAQSTGTSSDPAAAGAQQAKFNDAELKKFVEAHKGINEIRDEYMTKIESTESREKAQSLQMEANDKMATAIDEAGMDIPTYNAIATAYNQRPDLRDRIDNMM